MATARKKKETVANQPSGGWPKISQGTHLTVKTFEDGRTELVWDDDQLLKEVREATSQYVFSEPKVIEHTETKLTKVISVTKKTKGK